MDEENNVNEFEPTSTEPVTDPVTIRKLSIDCVGKLYKPLPSPVNEPVNEPVVPPVTIKDPLKTVSPLDEMLNKSTDPLDTVNISPVKSSTMLNRAPLEPLTSNTVEPELYSVVNPITSRLPDMMAEPVYGNVVSGAYEADVALLAYELDNAYELDSAYEADVAVFAYEAEVAYDAEVVDVAYDAVPVRSPMKEPLKEPVK